MPAEFQQQARQLESTLNSERATPLPSYLIERLLLDSDGYLERELANGSAANVGERLRSGREALAAAGMPVPAVEAMARYDWVARMLRGVVQKPNEHQPTLSDRIDGLLTHKILGSVIFMALMALVFSSIFIWANPAMNMIDDSVSWVGSLVKDYMADGPLRSLMVDGVIAGVGAVLVFLPQILILFFFIALLEDCGYMARAAFLMDRLMAGVGLSGKSFIPLLSSFACAIPGIMATRVIENRRDRLATILIAPLMSCSARLPVYVILIGAFVPNSRYFGGLVGLQGLTLLAMYAVGVVVAIGVAWVLKWTLLRGETPPFVLELPSYKLPSLRNVVQRMAERAWDFVSRAGTVIFAVTVVIWALAYYPRSASQVNAEIAAQRGNLRSVMIAAGDAEQAAAMRAVTEFDQPENLDHLAASLHQRYSFLGRAGHWIEPAVRPLGWDWRIGCAVIASFPAREVVMGALGVIYHLGRDVDVSGDEDQNRLREQLKAARWDDTGKPVYNLPVALSIMVFFALCAQCAATLAVIHRETNSWRWPVFTFAYMTVLAYVFALVTYQVGSRLLL
jgi:ferrous iron transport protein B